MHVARVPYLWDLFDCQAIDYLLAHCEFADEKNMNYLNKKKIRYFIRIRE